MLWSAAIPRQRDRFRKPQTRLRTPSAMTARQLIPDLNINNFIRFQRLAEREPQQRIRLAE
jgi:hypothetical protein